ncbi:NAD(P)H-dependent oxidoreductase [Enemella evansiae]|uniref:NAD(P)H-dependent oxidoreductase n=1 Tax=Enemella evansiae TaxID=2016499 RepID=UPI000B974C65|nr:Gfo/Idh/MocA family oxidoreductase [Enemella evansiae]OYO03152.1 flagellar biosynthesis protein FlgA [Enemella evansiae]OYO03835.1 flagellar biosynthesis protein FlgA [Enemella evansiae]TDO86331.1 putative homoserine dehydrogenase-like protein [Enemella evansiae]
MSLSQLMSRRVEREGPIRVGVIGAGKFASMFLAQIPTSPGLHVVAICDLDVPKARQALERVGWTAEAYAADSLDQARRDGTTVVTDDVTQLLTGDAVEVIVEATGHPVAGCEHAIRAIDAGRHVVMVNVEADVLVGPLLQRRAAAAGVVYTMAYGDQPALIAELVDWARTIGMEVVCAGKGTKYLPEYRASTPETVWSHYGFTDEQLAGGDFNPKMFNSFLDGTKSSIEMAAVANATGLLPPERGLEFPPVGAPDLPQALKPRTAGGVLARSGTVEVVSSLDRDGSEVPQDLRWGVYVTFRAPTEYAARCFAEYGMVTDDTGEFAALYRPYHLIGLELGVSVAQAVLRGESTGHVDHFAADVVSVAKRDLRAGELLDGEGGATVTGDVVPAASSLAARALPLGLSGGLKLERDVAAGAVVSAEDVRLDPADPTVRLRRELETSFG